MSSGPNDINYYEVLGVKADSNTKEITSAYRKLAIIHHPDKATTSFVSAERFHIINKAYQVLTDPETRRGLDAILATKRAQKEREISLDAKRRGLRDELLQREDEARRRKVQESQAELDLKREMDHLRRDSKIFKDENSKETPSKTLVFDDLDRTLKFSSGPGGKPLTTSILTELLSPYGTIDSIAVSPKRATALVQFTSVLVAKNVMAKFENEKSKELKCSWAKACAPNTEEAPLLHKLVNDRDFEDLTLMRMRQRAERAQMREKLEAECEKTE